MRRDLKPSPRGELEITDVNRDYLRRGALSVERLGRGVAWLDTGTHESLLSASQFVETIEERQALMICCVEEIAFRMGYITADALRDIALPMRSNSYGQYLLRLVESGPDGSGAVKVIPTALPGVLQIEPVVHHDARGFFLETYRADRYREAGIDVTFVQSNQSRSVRGTLRGLHWQDRTAPPGQADSRRRGGGVRRRGGRPARLADVRTLGGRAR